MGVYLFLLVYTHKGQKTILDVIFKDITKDTTVPFEAGLLIDLELTGYPLCPRYLLAFHAPILG